MTDAIRAESIRTLYLQARNSLGAALVITTYMAGAGWAFTPWPAIAGWTACVLAIQVARVMLIRAFDRAKPQGADLERWARYYTIHQGVTGIVWGSSMIVFVHFDEPITLALTLCCLYSIPAGSVPAQSYNPPTLFALVIPLFTFVVVRLLATGSYAYILVGIACALYAVTMLAYCRIQSRQVQESFRIRFENVELIEALTVQKSAAERARQDAEQANLAKSQFLAAASHDLRQPLYALSLFSASLSSLQLDRDGQNVVANIQESISAMESLFVGLLDVSRLDAGVVKAQLAPVSVDALFDRLSQYFHPVSVERGLHLRFRSDGEWVSSDATLLEQVLSNLVSNALRCTSKGGVLIAARPRGEQVHFEVWDTGIGVAEADRERIFGEFVQLDNQERDRRKGLGLGLSIAQRSAALLGTTVSLRSRLGRGSRFALTQPLAARPLAQLAIRPEPAWPLANAPTLGWPVLIVDDDRDVRQALGDLLTRWKVSFDLAATAEEALAWLDEGRRYGLVLADYRLPGSRNGLDLIAAVKTNHPEPQPSCALITGDFDPQLIGAAQAHGVPLFHKPLRPAKLREMIGLQSPSDLTPSRSGSAAHPSRAQASPAREDVRDATSA